MVSGGKVFAHFECTAVVVLGAALLEGRVSAHPVLARLLDAEARRLAARVLAEDARLRARVADAMLGGGNAARVRAAPLAAAFFADADALAGVNELLVREARAGARSPAYLRALRANAALFASSRGGGCAEAGARRALGAALRAAGAASDAPVPAPPADGGAVWAAKGTSLAAMSFLLAATAHGLATYPMEGFDGAQLARALSVDGARWRPLLVVAAWYEEAGAGAGAGAPPPRSTRPPMRDVVTLDGAPFDGADGGGGRESGERGENPEN